MEENGSGDIFIVECEETFPFQGYRGQKTIVLDEYEGQGISYKQLLRILDGHQLRLNLKGKHTYAKWNKVFITSNKDPNRWFPTGMTDALRRRLTNVTRFAGTKWAGNTVQPTEAHTSSGELIDEDLSLLD